MNGLGRRLWRRGNTGIAALTAGAVTVGIGIGFLTQPAAADTVPPLATPATVTADGLPTWQIDGVAWSQTIVGSTVYVAGSFSAARPPGAAVGDAASVARTNLLAYDLATGNLISSFNHVLNAQALVVTASPDGSTVYVGGDFTTVDGLNRGHVAAFSAATGALLPALTPGVDGQVKAMKVTDSTLYVGGSFTTVGGQARGFGAAYDTATRALNAWNPASSAAIWSLTMSPDGTKVILGGSFQTLGGQNRYGLGAVDVTTGTPTNWIASPVIRDFGTDASITSLLTTGDQIVGTGYSFGQGNYEGRFSIDATGNVNWLNDCHGDGYSAAVSNGVLYSVGHAHFCSNIGAFPETPTRTWHRALAETLTPSCTVAQNTQTGGSYANFAGYPCTTQLDWYPNVALGTITGQEQGAWSVAANSNYVVLAGEFPTVNGKAQQGLVRFAVSSIAPNKIGPKPATATFDTKLLSVTPGSVRVDWQTAWDMDNESLTYEVWRFGKTAPSYTTTANSKFWTTKDMSWTDTGLTPGATYKYFVKAIDPFGNALTSASVSITVATTAMAGQYYSDALGDGAANYWRLNQATGSTIGYDYGAQPQDLTVSAGVTGATTSALPNDTDPASTFAGNNTGLAATSLPIQAPNTFTVEAWFKTSSTAGGKIVGFGDRCCATVSANTDRHIYMDTSGRVLFGVYNGAQVRIQSGTGFNNGQWHYVVGSLSPAGMALYIDGKLIGSNSTTVGRNYVGFWRIGGDSTWSGAQYFNGSIDDVAIYRSALSLAQVRKHYVDAGGNFPGGVAPADAYGATVWNDQPARYYRMDEPSGTTAVDYSGNTTNGTFVGNETFQVDSPVSGANGKAVTFPGVTNATMYVGSAAAAAPTSYTEEVWFNTTSNKAGQLIGYGNRNTGSSTTVDRVLYMAANGSLNFGVSPSNTKTIITTPAGYNDGKWHHVVATQGASGMALYVDGQLKASNSYTSNRSLSGYWRVGGDAGWNNATWFTGSLDEVAIWNTALSAAQVAAHYTASSAYNHAPVAAFTSSKHLLDVSVDGTGSGDSDGSIASYSWNFGDGATATGATAAHSYTAAGTYTITLTVTDDGGATATTTSTVTVAPNALPVATFTPTVTNLAVSVDGSASTDADGTIASYAWDFGDGATATGATAAHTYAAAGTFTITLTVTDNEGGTNTSTTSVSVAPPPNVPPTASFTSSINFLAVSVNAGASADSDGSIVSYGWDFGDGATATGVTAAHTYAAAGTFTITLTVTDDRGAAATSTESVSVAPKPNVPPTASFTNSAQQLNASFNAGASADSDGSIVSYAWDFGDGATGSGVTTSHTYAAAGTYQVQLTVTDDKGATGVAVVAVSVSLAPTVIAADEFGRVVANGFGTADAGGPWTFSGTASNFAVNNGSGLMTIKTAGAGPAVYLNGVSSSDADTQVSFTTDRPGSATNGIDVSVVGRRVSTNDYNAKVRLLPNGTVKLGIYRTDTAGTQTAIVADTLITGLTYTPGDVLTVRFQITGTNPTALKAKIWKSTSTQPTGWTLSTTDGTAALQAAGAIGMKAYLPSTATNAPVLVTFSHLKAYVASTMPQ